MARHMITDDETVLPTTVEALNAYRCGLLNGGMPEHMVERIVVDAAHEMHRNGELNIVVPDPAGEATA